MSLTDTYINKYINRFQRRMTLRITVHLERAATRNLWRPLLTSFALLLPCWPPDVAAPKTIGFTRAVPLFYYGNALLLVLLQNSNF